MRRKMNEPWTGFVVGKMHEFGITNSELGKRCGYTTQYISMLLNGKKQFKKVDSKEKTKRHVMACLNEIVEEVKHE